MIDNIRIEITNTSVDIQQAIAFVKNPKHGGNSLFIGTIRNANRGKIVTAISYDMQELLAKKTLSQICQAAIKKHGGQLRIYVSHTKGKLAVGDAAIVIAVSSPHRKEALSACNDIIEQIKVAAPIWKKEYYTSGESEWVQGHALCEHG